MNREAQKLMAKIEEKKAELRAAAAAGKIAEVRATKKELDDLQEMLEAVLDLDDEEATAAQARAKSGKAEQVTGPTMAQKITAFIGVLTARISHRSPDPEHVSIVNAMNEQDPGEDGGLTVPQDIRTQIVELRRSQDNLEQYVNVEHVNTLTGSRVIEKDADATPWDEVDEAAVFGEAATPQFEQVSYKVTKKGGILKITEELLRDTAENIMGYLKKYIAKKTKATRNAYIIKLITDLKTAAGDVKEITSIDDLKDIFNVVLDPAVSVSSMVFTNQSGFNYLDKLKDSDGNYILQPDPIKKTQKLLFGAYPVIPLLNKTLETETTDGGSQYPVICGDLKEAITLFDREYMSIEISNTAGDLWEKDQTGVKVRDRFDVQAMDAGAVVFGYITEAAEG